MKSSATVAVTSIPKSKLSDQLKPELPSNEHTPGDNVEAFSSISKPQQLTASTSAGVPDDKLSSNKSAVDPTSLKSSSSGTVSGTRTVFISANTIEVADIDTTSQPTGLLLLVHLESDVSISDLGLSFKQFGRVAVRTLICKNKFNYCAILHFQNPNAEKAVEEARTAYTKMNGTVLPKFSRPLSIVYVKVPLNITMIAASESSDSVNRPTLPGELSPGLQTATGTNDTASSSASTHPVSSAPAAKKPLSITAKAFAPSTNAQPAFGNRQSAKSGDSSQFFPSYNSFLDSVKNATHSEEGPD